MRRRSARLARRAVSGGLLAWATFAAPTPAAPPPEMVEAPPPAPPAATTTVSSDRGPPTSLGESLTVQCTVCHGSAGRGNPVLSAPAIAGLPAWYLRSALRAYRSGIRGAHPEDEYGQTMRAVAMTLDDAAIDTVVAWAAGLPAGSALSRLSGDAAHGEQLYATCAECHGEDGAGQQALSAPPLAGRNDWYLARQITQYRDGIRGSHPDDPWGAAMQAVARTLTGPDDIDDLSTYLAGIRQTRTTSHQETHDMTGSPKRALSATALAAGLAAGLTMSTAGAEVTRHKLFNNSTFPIARAVETTADTTLVHHSGLTPRPVNPDAERYSAAFWGDTKTQAMSVFSRMETSLKDLGLGFGDIIKMTVFLVGDEAKGGRMDFSGFMEAYTQYFGTEEQPNLPARSAVQVAGLAVPGMLVEIEVILARPAEEQTAAAEATGD